MSEPELIRKIKSLNATERLRYKAKLAQIALAAPDDPFIQFFCDEGTKLLSDTAPRKSSTVKPPQSYQPAV